MSDIFDTAAAQAVTILDMSKQGARKCGDCQLCCKLLPVKTIQKPAHQKCRYQRAGKGCMVYHDSRRGFPPECGIWNCRWLVGDAGETRRPDRAHYVIDIMPDFVTVEDENTPLRREPVIQVWVDPDYPQAYREPALLAYIAGRNTCALIRYNELDGFLLIPPARNVTGEWMERGSNAVGPVHSFLDVVEAIGGRAP